MRQINYPKLHMTDSEIAQMFREAKDKREQITILAQMNCTTEDWIRIILVKRCGVDGRSLPRKKNGRYYSKKNAPPADLIAEVDPDEKPTEDAVDVPPSAPSEECATAPSPAKRGTVLLGVINDLTDMVEKLNDKRNELARTIADAEAQIKEIDVALVHLSTASQACARG